jgi:hypothetical protein
MMLSMPIHPTMMDLLRQHTNALRLVSCILMTLQAVRANTLEGQLLAATIAPCDGVCVIQVRDCTSGEGVVLLVTDNNGDDDDNEGDIFNVGGDDDDGIVRGGAAGEGRDQRPEGAEGVVGDGHVGDDDRLRVKQAEQFRKTNAGLSDMYDDSEGYYNFRVGEVMGGRCGLLVLLRTDCFVQQSSSTRNAGLSSMTSALRCCCCHTAETVGE